MSWNYRIVHQFGTHNPKYLRNNPDSEKVWHLYAIHEIYYPKLHDPPDGFTKNPVSPTGVNFIELTRSWQLYKKAFQRDVLHYDNDKEMFVEGEKEN